MARMRLWPATPHNPRICFTFDLLDWVEALMLECQVPLKDFCASLHFKCPYFFEKVSIKMLLDVYLYMIAIFSCLWLRERIYIFHFKMLLRLTGNYFSKFKHAVIIYCFIDSLNMQQLRIPSFICDKLDSGNVCPACPKVFYSLHNNINLCKSS